MPNNLTPEHIEELATRIARDLFTNGSNQRAQRLVLEGENCRYLGGWCETAVRDRVLAVLSAARAGEE